MDVAKLDWDIAYVVSVSSVSDVCCKCFDLFVACVSHMLQEYVANVSFLCYSKYFFMLQVFCLDVMLDMFHTCCKYMFQMFYALQTYVALSVSCCKCFVFQRYVQRVMGPDPSARERAR
jgi:hypothetical protein